MDNLVDLTNFSKFVHHFPNFSHFVDIYGSFGYFVDLFGLVSPAMCNEIPLYAVNSAALMHRVGCQPYYARCPQKFLVQSPYYARDIQHKWYHVFFPVWYFSSLLVPGHFQLTMHCIYNGFTSGDGDQTWLLQSFMLLLATSRGRFVFFLVQPKELHYASKII